MKNSYILLLTAQIFTGLSYLNAQETVVLTPFASGFTSPVIITHAGDSR
jgi:hypothetical protein